jgi:hypothetical protein
MASKTSLKRSFMLEVRDDGSMGSELVPCIECPCDVSSHSQRLLHDADEKDRASLVYASALIGAAAARSIITMATRQARDGEAGETSLVGLEMAE